MDQSIVARTIEPRIFVRWPVAYDYEQLLLTLHEATRKANRLGHPLLVSFTQPVAAYDPLLVFAANHKRGQTSFFWEQPAQQRALIGLGEVILIEAGGDTRFTTVVNHWQEVLQQAVIRKVQTDRAMYSSEHITGPALFGGFAFDPHGSRSRLWRNFPNTLFLLPSMLLSCYKGSTSLTVNHFVRPGDDEEALAISIATSIADLYERVGQTALPAVSQPPIPPLEQADPHLLSGQAWTQVVADTVQTIQQGAYQKVVLARGSKHTLASSTASFDRIATLEHLRRHHPNAYVFMLERGNRAFLGATPEQLVSLQQGQIKTMALAGSAPRSLTPTDDLRLGDALLASPKDRQEHELVVAMIRTCLKTFCSTVTASSEPQLLKLKHIQHLITPITGELYAEHSILDVVAALHPTPAVGGLPRQPALEAIRSHEQLDRGWYSGPLGWFDAQGNGEFAVALRCGLLEQKQAILFAGCGLVADSDPQREYAESCLKLRSMLQSLCETNSRD